MIAQTGRRTVPQIFIGETWVGGCDDLIALDQKGGLMPLLERLRIIPHRAGHRGLRHNAALQPAPSRFAGFVLFETPPWLNKTNPPFSRSSAST